MFIRSSYANEWWPLRFELALSWFGGLDGLDVAMMDFLSHGPAVCIITWHLLLSLAALGVVLMYNPLDLPFVCILQSQSENRHCCPCR